MKAGITAGTPHYAGRKESPWPASPVIYLLLLEYSNHSLKKIMKLQSFIDYDKPFWNAFLIVA